MGKYDPLKKYLMDLSEYQSDITLTFEQINKIIASEIPKSAYKYRAWWSNEKNGVHVSAHAWMDAGWKVDTVNQRTFWVRFIRQRMPIKPTAISPKIYIEKQPAKINDGSNFQRVGADNNAKVGDEFECAAQSYFDGQGTKLTRNHALQIGVSDKKKSHNFDLGCDEPKMIVECKSPSVEINQKAFDQVTLYNQKYFAKYVLVTNGRKHYCCMVDMKKKSYRFLKDIPEYAAICQ